MGRQLLYIQCGGGIGVCCGGTIIILLAIAGVIFNIVGLIYSSVSLKQVTHPLARICHITIIVAYVTGIISTILVLFQSRSAAANCREFLCKYIGYAMSLYGLAILIFAQVVYFKAERNTYCSGGTCSKTYSVAVLGYIISHYIILAVSLLTLIFILSCCRSKN